MLISIAIPAHNRPAFLLEAVQSIADQTYPNFEVIVVDDGSVPPISRSALEDVLGQRVTLYRHEVAQGVPKAKNAGINAAHGEVILLLDDDDLLMPDALECIHSVFSNHPGIDCLFLGVRPFGPYAEGTVKSRNAALSAVIENSRPVERDGIYFFSDSLFGALLNTVPIDFQRPAARRSMWNIVGGFDESCLFSESAWAIHASCVGTIALTRKPITQWRIHGDNFGWPSGIELDQIRRRQFDNGICAGKELLRTFKNEERAWRIRARMIKGRHSGQLFGKAYYLRDKDWLEGIRALLHSFFLAPRPLHLKLAAKYLIPLRWLEQASASKETDDA